MSATAVEQIQQLEFEGMPIHEVTCKLKSTKVTGLRKLQIGDKVRVEVEAIVVEANHKYDEEVGGVRVNILEAIEARAVETL